MKLQAIITALIIRHAGNGRTVGAGHNPEPGGKFFYTVTVTHPDIEQAIAFITHVILDIGQQPGMSARPYLRITVFMMVGILDLAPQLRCHGLHAVADTKYRYTQLKDGLRCAWCFIGGDRFRPPGKNNALGCKVPQRILLHIIGVNFAIHASFAHAACDKLGVL